MMRHSVSRILWTLVFIVVVVDFGLYLKKDYVTEQQEEVADCNLDLLAQDARSTVPATPPGTAQKPSASVAGFSAAKDLTVNTNVVSSAEICHPGTPCVYPDKVDLRIIVLTYNRRDSVKKLLNSLNDLELDGDSAALEIFIDRGKSGVFHQDTYDAVVAHAWNLGEKRVHVWQEHVGIYGQWIHSWRPQEGEIALILEDDISVSRFCYRWLKAAHRFYGNRSDISGYTLQSSNVKSAKGGRSFSAPKDHSAFLYRVLGSWGFSPHPDRWMEFQDWFKTARNDSSFHPYVDGIVMTNWYKSFEQKKSHDSMWTMWHIWFTDHHNLFCLLHNLRKFSGLKSSALAVNRQEPGLHYHGKGIDNTKELLVEWKEEFVKFPNNTIKYDYNAAAIV